MDTNHATPATIESLERATLDAVVPQRIEALDGWLLPFDPSTIGRAKSAVPLRHADLSPATLAAIEARYHAADLPAAFRLADLPGLARLHDTLRAMGYQPEQPTLVQTGTLTQLLACLKDAPPALVHPEPVSDWAAVYTAPGFDPVDGAHRVQALSRSRQALYAHVLRDGAPAAAGVCALGYGWASIHGMRTVVGLRGQGLAGQVLRGLGLQARARGLEQMFLQVEEDNRAARALYARVGFVTAWRYHYWRQP